MDNRAYEKYTATQPVAPRPERVAAEPLSTLSTVEITVIIIIGAMVIYAVYAIIKNLRKPPN